MESYSRLSRNPLDSQKVENALGVERFLQDRAQRLFSPALRSVVPSLPHARLQWLELAAHNGLVAGSSPAGPTILVILVRTL